MSNNDNVMRPDNQGYAPHISQLLADKVQGTWRRAHFKDDLEWLNFLASLSALYKATHLIGDIEHTGDWDWYVGIELEGGLKIGDSAYVNPNIPDDEPFVHCDTFSVLGDDEPIKLIPYNSNERAGNVTVRLEVWDSDGMKATIHNVIVRSIQEIHISQL